MRNDRNRRTLMAVTLNRHAYEHAKALIEEGRFVFDERDAWSEHQPSAIEESEYIRLHGFAEYGKMVFGGQQREAREYQGTLRVSLWGFQKSPSLWRARCGKPCRPIPALRHRECGSAPAWNDGGPQGRIGPEALAAASAGKRRAEPGIRCDDPTPFQRFAAQKTRLNTTLTSKHVISGK